MPHCCHVVTQKSRELRDTCEPLASGGTPTLRLDLDSSTHFSPQRGYSFHPGGSRFAFPHCPLFLARKARTIWRRVSVDSRTQTAKRANKLTGNQLRYLVTESRGDNTSRLNSDTPYQQAEPKEKQTTIMSTTNEEHAIGDGQTLSLVESSDGGDEYEPPTTKQSHRDSSKPLLTKRRRKMRRGAFVSSFWPPGRRSWRRWWNSSVAPKNPWTPLRHH